VTIGGDIPCACVSRDAQGPDIEFFMNGHISKYEHCDRQQDGQGQEAPDFDW
jgi:hypothetical protein